MTDVVRLDFTKPPPVDLFSLRGLDLLPPSIQAEKIANAWDGYKHRYDPPGLELWQTRLRGGGVDQEVWVFSGAGAKVGIDWFVEKAEARVAAWAWHDRRHALVKALEDEGLQIPLWPALLTRTDDDCAACESWLTRGPAWAADDFPTVLKALARPCGPHCDCEANGHD